MTMDPLASVGGRRFFAVLLLISSLAGGCSTVVIDRSTAIAETGRAYVDTLKKVNGLALERSLEFTAGTLPAMARTQAVLADTTAAMRERVKLVAAANDHLDGIGAYFAELQALASGDASDATVKSVGRAAEALAAAPLGLELPASRKQALTGLAGLVARRHLSVALEQALARDADVVAQALATADRMLEEELGWLEMRESLERRRAYAQDVERPFTAGGALGPGWRRAWIAQVRGPPLAQVIADARAASASMQKAWIDILRGRTSTAEVGAALKSVREGIAAAGAPERDN